MHEAARREVARVQAGDVMEKFTAAYLRGADAVVSNSLCATRVHMRSDRMLLCSRWYQSVRRSRVGRFSVSARRRPGDRIKSYAAKPGAQVLYRRVGAGGSLAFLAPALLDLLTVGLAIFAPALLICSTWASRYLRPRSLSCSRWASLYVLLYSRFCSLICSRWAFLYSRLRSKTSSRFVR